MLILEIDFPERQDRGEVLLGAPDECGGQEGEVLIPGELEGGLFSAGVAPEHPDEVESDSEFFQALLTRLISPRLPPVPACPFHLDSFFLS